MSTTTGPTGGRPHRVVRAGGAAGAYRGRAAARASVAGVLAADALIVEVLGGGAAAPGAPPPGPAGVLRGVRHRAVVLGRS